MIVTYMILIVTYNFVPLSVLNRNGIIIVGEHRDMHNKFIHNFA